MTKKITALLLLFFISIAGATTGCQSEDDQYRPTPENTPDIPEENPRAGAAEEFLPPSPEE